MDTLLESLITVVTEHPFIDDSIKRIVDSKSTDSEQNDLVLVEAGKRLLLKRASAHNALVWPLSVDLTIEVFSMIDTQTLCKVAAVCSFFRDCTMDPLCFANFDLVRTTPKVNNDKVNNDLVSRLIQRAGENIQSIKVGGPPHSKLLRHGEISIITVDCLSSLDTNGYASCLKRLHLHNIRGTYAREFLTLLSLCRSLVDLKIVLNEWTNWKRILESLSGHCPLLERLSFETSPAGVYDRLKSACISQFIENCPNITTLALKGFIISDSVAYQLVEGFHKLKYVDFSASDSFDGSFLENLGSNGGGNCLEVMILRNVSSLKKAKVMQFMAALLAGDWRSLCYLDISHDLASERSECHRRMTSSFPINQLLEERPNFHLVAEFGKSCSESEETSRERSLSSSDSSRDTVTLHEHIDDSSETEEISQGE